MVLAALLAREDARELATDGVRELAFELALLPTTDPRGDTPAVEGREVINIAPVILGCSPARGVGGPLVAITVVSNSMDFVASGVTDNPLDDTPLERESGHFCKFFLTSRPSIGIELRYNNILYLEPILLVELLAEDSTELLRLDPGEGGGGRLAWNSRNKMSMDQIMH